MIIRALLLLFPLWLFASPSLQLSLRGSSPAIDQERLLISISKALYSDRIGQTTHEKVLRCTPAIQAFYTFENSRNLALYPLKPLQPNTNYRCRLNDKQPASPLTFKTLGLEVHAKRMNRFIELDFNAPVDTNRLNKNLKLFRSKNLSNSKLPFDLTASHDRRHIAVHINENISEDTLTLIINKTFFRGANEDFTAKLFAKTRPSATIDKKRKSMLITDKPRFLAQENGNLAIRLYLPHYFYASTPVKPFLHIDGLSQFQVSTPSYIYYDERKKYKISPNTYYYVDISGKFEPNKSYTLHIDKGLKDSYSFQLKQDQRFKVTMKDRKAAMRFESQKPYLSNQGTVGFTTVNTPYVSVVVEKVLDQNFHYFVNFDQADPDLSYKFVKEVITKKFDLTQEKNRFLTHKISLKPFMKAMDSGVYRITLHYKQKQLSKTVFYSDIALSAKVADDQLFVWATSLAQATPLKALNIALYSDKNTLIAKSRTDKNGVAVIDQKKLSGKHPKFIIANNGKMQGFIYLNSPFNGVALPFKNDLSHRYKSFTYLQSDLVRPGNDANILFILKDRYYRAASKLPIKITVSDPSYRKIYEQSVTTSASGAFTLTLPIDRSARTGHYTITVKMGKTLIGSRRFSVENFIPQKIKNEIALPKTLFKNHDWLQADFSSRYLFGAIASNLKAKAKLTALSKRYTNPSYKGYRFTDTLKAKNNAKIYLQKEQSFTLDAKGKAQKLFALNIHQMPPSILEAQIALTVFDDGRGVSTYKKVTIYPYESMVGLKAKKTQIQKEDALELDLITIDPFSGKKLSRLIDIKVIKNSWSYYYDTKGYFKWQQKHTTVQNFERQSNKKIDLHLASSGDYTLIATDPVSHHSSSLNFSVRGWDYNSFNPSNDLTKLQIKAAQNDVKKGDTLNVDITAPLQKGSMLITLESAKVLWHKVVTVSKGSVSLNIPITFETPNGLYLKAVMIRSSDTPDTLLPFRAKNGLYIKPDLSSHRQKVVIETLKNNRSHTAQEIKVVARPHSRILVSVVDEGILQIKGQKPPKAFNYFETKAKDKIAYYDIFDKVMHYVTKGTLLHFGGDDARAFARARKHLSPKTGAKRVKPFLFWSKIIEADKNGIAHTSLPIPAFAGSAQIVALAFDRNSIGVAHQKLLIKDAIIIKPTYPRFLYSGDRLSLPVRIFNTSDKALSLTLDAKTSDNIELQFKQSTITLAPKSNQLLYARLEAKAFGKATARIQAHNKKAVFVSEMELPITSAFALSTKVYRGETQKTKEILVDSQYLQQGTEKVLMSFSDSYLAQVATSANALIQYPYGCAEQTSSKLFAMLYIKDLIKSSDATYLKNLLADRDNFIHDGIAKLQNMQTYSGYFGYWTQNSFVNPYASIYASDLIFELKKAGYTIPDTLLAKLYKGLKQFAAGHSSFKWARFTRFEQLYAAYLLSTQSLLPRSTLNFLYDKKIYQYSFVTRYMMAAMLKNAGETNAMQKVLTEIEAFKTFNLRNRLGKDDSFYSRKRDLAFALYIHVSNFKKNAMSQSLLEEIMSKNRGYESTQTKAFVMRAVMAYYKNAKPNKMNGTLAVNDKRYSLTKPTFIGLDHLNTPISIIPKRSIINYAIEVSNYLEKPIYHKPISAQKSRLKVARSYVDDQGKVIDPNSLTVGSLFYSKVEIRSDSAIKNIVISDRFPSSFEIVNERLTAHKRSPAIKNSQNFHPNHQDIRDNQMLTFLNLPMPRRNYDPKTRQYTYRTKSQTFYTPMRVVSRGSFKFPALVAEAMYDGRIAAYDKAYDQITITQSSNASQDDRKNTPKQAW